MSDPESIYPPIETGYAFTPDMNEDFVNKFNSQTFTQGSAILKIKYYNPKNLIVQHLLVKEEEKKVEINRMRNGYIVQTFTSVDIQEFVKIGGRVIEIYEGVIYVCKGKLHSCERGMAKGKLPHGPKFDAIQFHHIYSTSLLKSLSALS